MGLRWTLCWISQPRIIYMWNKRSRETCTDSCFVLYCHWTYKKVELCTGLCITVCEQYMFYLYDTHLCVCYSPLAMALFPGGWNAVTVMIDSRSSSTDTSLFKERSTASRSLFLSLSIPRSLRPLFFSLSLSLQCRLSNLPCAQLLTSNLKWA